MGHTESCPSLLPPRARGKDEVSLPATLEGLHRDWPAARARGEIGVAERLLARLRPGAALVTVGDFHPVTLSWLGAVAGNAIVPLRVDRFGQSGDIPDLYRVYGIETDAILDAAARAGLLVLH